MTELVDILRGMGQEASDRHKRELAAQAAAYDNHQITLSNLMKDQVMADYYRGLTNRNNEELSQLQENRPLLLEQFQLGLDSARLKNSLDHQFSEQERKTQQAADQAALTYKNITNQYTGPLLQAQTAQAQAGAYAQQQAANLSQLQQQVTQNTLRQNQLLKSRQDFDFKNNVIVNSLKGANLNDPSQVDKALSEAARYLNSAGIPMNDTDSALVRADPAAFIAHAANISNAGKVPGQDILDYKSKLQREEDAAKANAMVSAAVAKSGLTPQKPFSLSAADAKGQEFTGVVNRLGQSMLGWNYLNAFDKDSKDYNPTVANTIKTAAQQIIYSAGTGATDKQDFRRRAAAMTDTYLKTYNAGLAKTQDPEKAFAYMPANPEEAVQISQQVSALGDPNSPASRLIRFIKQQGLEGVTNHQASLKARGIALGLNPKTVDYLIDMMSDQMQRVKQAPSSEGFM
jgi:hypothetical protein